jgi:predicted nucleotidyltransferase
MKPLLVPDELLTKVDEILPKQPWPTGIHIAVAKELNISIDIVSGAIRKLIRIGKRYYQHAGIVYDKNHQIVCYDTERVTEEQLQEARSKKSPSN